MAEESRATEAANKALVRAAFDRWAEGVGSPFDLLADDATWTIVGNAPVSRTYQSRQEFLDQVFGPFNARMSSRLVPTAPTLYAEGDMVIAFFHSAGVARDGRPYRNTYSWYMRMAGDKIVEGTAFFDTIEFTDLWTRIAPAPVKPAG
jgi:ketosteroid isomerase-like protein